MSLKGKKRQYIFSEIGTQSFFLIIPSIGDIHCNGEELQNDHESCPHFGHVSINLDWQDEEGDSETEEEQLFADSAQQLPDLANHY